MGKKLGFVFIDRIFLNLIHRKKKTHYYVQTNLHIHFSIAFNNNRSLFLQINESIIQESFPAITLIFK